MPESLLAKKLKLKVGQRAAIIHAPQGYLEDLRPLPDGVDLFDHVEAGLDWAQLFVKSKSELDQLAPQVIGALKPESLLWISFPKGTSKIQTDLTRDKGWDTLQKADLKWITLILVNETWSAFALRPYRSGEEHQSFR